MAEIHRDERGRFAARLDTLPISPETSDLAIIDSLLGQYTFDQRWRMLNHMCIKHLGRAWRLVLPQSDVK